MESAFGKIHDFDRFDSTFFGLPKQFTEMIDPQGRLLLEVVYEAIVDAGVNPQDLRGSKTGVYVGVSLYPNLDGNADEIQPDLVHTIHKASMQTLANTKSIYASRISFVFDFKGPSLIVDTACSASMTATTLAMNDLRLGMQSVSVSSV
ncbi:unnamed protein product, partial [Medioppia subpectinata]